MAKGERSGLRRTVTRTFQAARRRQGAFDLGGDHRLTGVVLILAFISFAICVTLPLVGEKANMRIYTLSNKEEYQWPTQLFDGVECS